MSIFDKKKKKKKGSNASVGFFKNYKFASDFSDDMKVPREKISIYFSPFLSHFLLKESLWMVKKVKIKDMMCTYR